jgi:hypothetical protein
MGLSVAPYQMRTQTTGDLNQRFRRLHMHAPLRHLTAPMPVEYPPALEIHAYSLRNRQSNDVEQRQFRRQSLLSSPSLGTGDIARVNIEFDQDLTLPTRIVGRRLLDRRLSNAK